MLLLVVYCSLSFGVKDDRFVAWANAGCMGLVFAPGGGVVCCCSCFVCVLTMCWVLVGCCFVLGWYSVFAFYFWVYFV